MKRKRKTILFNTPKKCAERPYSPLKVIKAERSKSINVINFFFFALTVCDYFFQGDRS